MINQGEQIRKVLISNFKQQLNIFKILIQLIHKISKQEKITQMTVEYFNNIQVQYSKWRNLTDQNKSLLIKYINEAKEYIKYYQQYQIAVTTQKYIQQEIQRLEYNHWPMNISSKIIQLSALQKYNLQPIVNNI